MENMERLAILAVTSEQWDQLSALVNAVGAHGAVVAVDDPLERITLALADMRLCFVVVGGNSLEPSMVMLLSINDQIVLADETAGLWEIHPHIGTRITELFSRHGSCERCMRGEHAACVRQRGEGRCRCECGIDWALYRVRKSLRAPLMIEAAPPAAEPPGAAEVVPMPHRAAPEQH